MTGSLIRLLLPFATSFIARQENPRGPSFVLYGMAAVSGLFGFGFLLFGGYFLLEAPLGPGRAALAVAGAAVLVSAICVIAVQVRRAIRRKKQNDLLGALLEGDGGGISKSLGETVGQVQTLVRENPGEAVTMAVLLGAVVGASGVFSDD